MNLLQGFRYYQIKMDTPTLGLDIGLVQQRVVVARLTDARVRASKPAVGEILVAVDGYPMSDQARLDSVVNSLRVMLQRQPVTLTFYYCTYFFLINENDNDSKSNG